MVNVSVLIPAYNVEAYIKDCLDSVLSQTMQNMEVICVDDASTDGTLDILREYEKIDPRIHVLCHEENMGQSCGRNEAFSYATGKYVYMLDADDRIVPGMIGELYSLCEEQQLDVAGFENRQFTDDPALEEEAAKKTISYKEYPVMDGREALIHCMQDETFSLSVPTFFIRRDYINEIGLSFIEGILHEDAGYLFELITKAGRIRFLHKVFFERRIRANSTMTGGFTSDNIEGYLRSFLRSFDIEDELYALYGADDEFVSAIEKWRRDIFGRIRQIYLLSEETVYSQPGGSVDEEIRHLFEVIKLTTPGRARAEDIFGKELCGILMSLPVLPGEVTRSVYICGTGEYARRAIDLVGALGLVIHGVLVLKKDKEAFCGFPVREIDMSDDADKDVPVILSISHYQLEEYETCFEKNGFKHLLHAKW